MKFIFKLLGFVLIAVILAVGALFFLPGERIARIAAERISDMTGREVTMSGETSISFYPILGISTGATTIANAEWGTGGPMLSAKSFKVGVDPMALIAGDIKITGLEITDPSIVIERDRNGRGNWQIGVDGVASSGQSEQSGGAPGAASNPLALTLDRALITNASVTYIDHAAGTRQHLGGMDLDMRWPTYAGEATFDAVLRPGKQDVHLTGRLGTLGPFLEGAVSPLEITVTTDGGTLALNGRASAAPQLDAQLSADIGNTSRFMAALGLPATQPPAGLGRSIKARTNINLTEDLRVALRDLSLGLDGNALTGNADVVTAGARPRITAQLSAGALDLTGLTGGEGGAAPAAGTGGGAPSERWSTAPIDAGALGAADANISLTASSLDLGQFKFGAARILLTIDNARAVAQLQQLEGYGGAITGQVVANNRSGLSVGGDLTARGIDMERLLTDAAGITRFATTGTASLDFLGVGQSVDAIMHRLSGNLKLATGRGVISGFDLDRLMRTGDGSGGTTVFDEVGASFAIKDGDMRGDDLTMSMPLATATGKGRIGLGARDIDYLFTPVLLQGENSRGLAIPVRIRGPWADPSIRPDLEKAIDLNFKEEREKLEKKAREDIEKEIDKFVEKELGVQKQQGQSIEDALKDDVKRRAAKELFKLFD
ncbi:AsmA family protein [Pelagivirga sediminicola]|uniref:AsmA family protein n=1 Tax=Pelagivirga sediminicola TaxID=2170575 RepID=A0A2T7GA29_9RHOB|nr:AsmA family protein [Pelagivirga sediminicola]PVA11271.1 AsmA family protein [Pelagivirga sediminicola]